MIVWQLKNVLSSNRALIEELKQFPNFDSLSEELTIKFLAESEEVFSVCSDGNLRLGEQKYAFDIGVTEELNAIEAYKKFGGQALSEVIDYGSWSIPTAI